MVKIASHEPPRIRKKGFSLKVKATVWAIIISLLPVISFSIGSYLFITEFIARYVDQARQAKIPELLETVMVLEKDLFGLLIATAITALFISIGTVWLANRAMAPIIRAAKVSGTLVNRLVRGNVSAQERLAIRDEIALIRTNLSVLEEQLPELMWQHEAHLERTGLLLQINRKIQVCVTERELFKTAVEELRLAVKADRVVVFCFDEHWNGTFVEEAIVPGWPKTLWATINDPCFETDYAGKYLDGRVRAISNIYEAGLTDCHIGLLERFAVKANLVAPVVKNNRLYCLIIAHQCSRPRNWQQVEIHLFAQVAMHVGFTLERMGKTKELEEIYQQGEARMRKKLAEQESLQAELSAFLDQSQNALKSLHYDTPKQMDLVSSAYNQVKEVREESRGVFALERQLTGNIDQIKSLVEAVQAEIQELALAIQSQTAEPMKSAKVIESIQPQLNCIAIVNTQISSLMEKLSRTASQISPALDSATEEMLEVARIAKQNSEQYSTLVDAVKKLHLLNQKFKTHLEKSNPMSSHAKIKYHTNGSIKSYHVEAS